MHAPPMPTRPARRRWPLFDVAASRAIEAEALAAHAAAHADAARRPAVARLALAWRRTRAASGSPAGPGNNGGDGLEGGAAAAPRRASEVQVSLLGDAARLPDDARDALAARAGGRRADRRRRCPTPRAPTWRSTRCSASAQPRAAKARSPRPIDRLNAAACPVLAVDLPSGLNADTGQPLGDACVRATHTLSLLTLKPGLFTGRRARPCRPGLVRRPGRRPRARSRPTPGWPAPATARGAARRARHASTRAASATWPWSAARRA